MARRFAVALAVVLMASGCSDDPAAGGGDGGVASDAGHSGSALTTCPTGYVRVEAGTFTMGSPAGEAGRESDEAQHAVTLTRPFCMKATEVTRDEFFAALGYHADDTSTAGGSHPEADVQWVEAASFCNALSRRDGLDECYECTGSMSDWTLKCPRKSGWLTCHGYRLPSEAEWEYGARAGATTAFPNGDYVVGGMCESDTLAAVGWFCGNSQNATHPVGTLQANTWGLYDMLGNVEEWTNDGYADYPAGAVTDPFVDSGLGIAVRGGSYAVDAEACRLASRNHSSGDGTQGIRPVRYLE